MFYLGVESGGSFPWSNKWQSKTVMGFKLQQLPELLISVILGFITIQGYDLAGMEIAAGWWVAIFFALSAIIYAGIQSATWLFLQWEGHKDPQTKRGAKTKAIVDWLAKRWGWKLGDEGYSWVAASVKGAIITLPMGGLGGILFALGYEIGSHAHKVDKWFNPAIISEGMSFVGVGVYALLFLEVCKMVGGL